MVFPMAKLAYMAIRQLSKPLASAIKRRAKSSPLFRNYVCMPPAQLYHWADTQLKMRFLDLVPTKIERLSESMAVEQGAEILGELVIFSVAAGCLYLEYWRSSSKEQRKEDMQNDKLDELKEKIDDLVMTVAEQDTKLREMNRLVSQLDASRTVYDKEVKFIVTKDSKKDKHR